MLRVGQLTEVLAGLFGVVNAGVEIQTPTTING